MSTQPEIPDQQPESSKAGEPEAAPQTEPCAETEVDDSSSASLLPGDLTLSSFVMSGRHGATPPAPNDGAEVAASSAEAAGWLPANSEPYSREQELSLRNVIVRQAKHISRLQVSLQELKREKDEELLELEFRVRADATFSKILDPEELTFEALCLVKAAVKGGCAVLIARSGEGEYEGYGSIFEDNRDFVYEVCDKLVHGMNVLYEPSQLRPEVLQGMLVELGAGNYCQAFPVFTHGDSERKIRGGLFLFRKSHFYDPCSQACVQHVVERMERQLDTIDRMDRTSLG